MWRAAVAAILLHGGAATASAEPVPDWALGKWIATSAIERVEIQGFGGNFVEQLTETLPATQLNIQADSIAESSSPHNLSLAWGVGLSAKTSRLGLQSILGNITHPFIYGEQLTYDPDKPVVSAQLTMNYCGEDGGRFRQEGRTPIYQFPKIHRSCTGYTVFRFPDDLHIAMWRKDRDGRNDGLVIFKKYDSVF